MLKIFQQFQKANVYLFILGIFFSAIECVVSSIQPYLLLLLTNTFQNVINNIGDNKESIDYALNLIYIIIGLGIIGVIGRMVSRVFHIKSGIEIITRLRNKLFAKIQWIKENELNQFSLSSLVTRTTNDIYQFQETVLFFFLFFFESILLMIGSLVFCIIISPILSCVFIFVFPLVMCVTFLANFKAKKHYEKSLKELDVVNQVMYENIMGSKTIRLFNLQHFQENRFDISNLKWYQSVYKGEMAVYFGFIFMFYALNISVVVVLLTSGLINYNNIETANQISLPAIIAFINYLIYAVFCASGVGNGIVATVRTKPAINRINEVIAKENECFNNEDIKLDNLNIIFDNVSFTYEINDKNNLTIKDVSFNIKPGQILGIIGPTGSGKSTIARLLSGNLTPFKGEIKFGNIVLNENNLNLIRKNVSVAFQEKFIFSGTIKSNILMGKLNATDLEIKHAADLAYATEFINKDMKKFEAKITQNGNNLSGGQKQRLALARCFIKNANCYVIDDCLSALDNITRDKVLNNIKQNFKNKSFVIIAQQVNTIKDADKIIVLNNGQLIATGNHQQLIKTCDFYQKIYESQKTIGS